MQPLPILQLRCPETVKSQFPVILKGLADPKVLLSRDPRMPMSAGAWNPKVPVSAGV